MQSARSLLASLERRTLEVLEDVERHERQRAAHVGGRAGDLIRHYARRKAQAAAHGFADAVRERPEDASAYREDLDAPAYYDGYSIGARELQLTY